MALYLFNRFEFNPMSQANFIFLILWFSFLFLAHPFRGGHLYGAFYSTIDRRFSLKTTIRGQQHRCSQQKQRWRMTPV